MEWKYREDNMAASFLREQYEDSLDRLLATRRIALEQLREAYTKQIIADPDAAREDFVKMLGWPLTEYVPEQPLQVRSTMLHETEELQIFRVQLEIWKDFWFGGLLFLHPDGAQRPFVLAQHGGAGTPELCSGLLEMGSVNYNDMSHRLFEMGANVFASQLYLWRGDLFGLRPDQTDAIQRKEMDVSLKNVGGSMIAVELTCLRRVLDYFEAMPYVKPGALGMVGLSYGGQYTLFFSAVEPRIKAAVSSCYFNDRHTLEWPDYTWFGAAERFLDEQVALLTRPRRLFIQVADNDEIFHADGAQRAWKRLQKYSADDLSWVDFRMFHGVHELDKDDGQLLQMMEILKNI